mmetsp:Transcript_118051/g.270801  ORF Transcript_118051/g.270801 Transcript_118051/m.270801 type:complete len:375 (-) Transcript_118051:32-1156(-)
MAARACFSLDQDWSPALALSHARILSEAFPEVPLEGLLQAGIPAWNPTNVTAVFYAQGQPWMGMSSRSPEGTLKALSQAAAEDCVKLLRPHVSTRIELQEWTGVLAPIECVKATWMKGTATVGAAVYTIVAHRGHLIPDIQLLAFNTPRLWQEVGGGFLSALAEHAAQVAAKAEPLRVRAVETLLSAAYAPEEHTLFSFQEGWTPEVAKTHAEVLAEAFPEVPKATQKLLIMGQWKAHLGSIPVSAVRLVAGEVAAAAVFAIVGHQRITDLQLFAVTKDRQKSGVGRRLASTLESYSLAKGCQRIFLHSARRAVLFWSRCGFDQHVKSREEDELNRILWVFHCQRMVKKITDEVIAPVVRRSNRAKRARLDLYT